MTQNLFTDDVFSEFIGWHQPYRFIVFRQLKWDESHVEILNIADRADEAYAVYDFYCKSAQDSIRDVLYEYFLHDSFHRDALEYCKQEYDQAVSEGQKFNVTL